MLNITLHCLWKSDVGSFNSFQSDILVILLKVMLVKGHRSKIIHDRKFYISLQQKSMYFTAWYGMLIRKHRTYTYTTFKLIQMRVKDNQRWQQIQNPMPSPRLHTLELMVICMPSGRWHMVWRGSYILLCTNLPN